MSVDITGAHPLAEEWPIRDDVLDEIRQSIAEHGLRHPIVITRDGLILDGRTRYQACVNLGIEPAVEVYEGEDYLEYIIDANSSRRNESTGTRAMIVARMLVKADRRENGRWAYATSNFSQEKSNAFGVALSRAGVVLDFAPDLAPRVVAGDLPLKTAFEWADQIRRSADADKLAKKADEKKAREAAKAQADKEAKIRADLAEVSPQYLALIDAGTLTPAAAWAAYMADTEKERRADRDRRDSIRSACMKTAECVFYLGTTRGDEYVTDYLPHQSEFVPAGMQVTAQRIDAAIAYLTTARKAFQ